MVSLRLETNSLEQVLYKTDTQRKNIDKWDGYPQKGSTNSGGWVRYMLLESLHRWDNGEGLQTESGHNGIYTSTEKGPEFGDEAATAAMTATTDDDSHEGHDGHDGHDGNNGHDGYDGHDGNDGHTMAMTTMIATMARIALRGC